MVEQNTVSLCGTCIHFRESVYPGHKNHGLTFLAGLKMLSETTDPEEPVADYRRMYSDRFQKMEQAGYGLGYLTCKPPSLLVGAYWICQNPDLYTSKAK